MHVITGEIRKDVYSKTGSNNNGEWKMYIVELSESYKDKDGNRKYTNYSATFFAKQNQIQYYDQWLRKGKVVSVSAQTLEVDNRDSNGTLYTTLRLNNPQLNFFQSEPAQGGGNGWGQPQQPQQNSQPQQQRSPQKNNQQQSGTPMDFEDDIPF